MIIKLLAYLLILTITNVNLSVADDCNKFDKLSKEYAKCTAELIKEKTSEKAELIKEKTSEKYKEGKKKLNKLNLKEKLIKFKNSKSHKEFTEK
ncbi:hypothetical protein [Candidatus Pelagibacter sp. HIMB1493]|uniref:hypothetical protein n=1 Tax=Candidatus Pelagibacter sp. HIMB1493 TaxID=3413334 RepID=UPI003F8397C3